MLVFASDKIFLNFFLIVSFDCRVAFGYKRVGSEHRLCSVGAKLVVFSIHCNVLGFTDVFPDQNSRWSISFNRAIYR